MPLHEGAKPGSKGFGENIKTEMEHGKPQKQAVAIAYRESGEKRGGKDSKDCMTDQGNAGPAKGEASHKIEYDKKRGAKDAAPTSPSPPAPVRPGSRAADQGGGGSMTGPSAGVPVWPGRVV